MTTTRTNSRRQAALVFVEGSHAGSMKQSFRFRKGLGLPITKPAFFDGESVARFGLGGNRWRGQTGVGHWFKAGQPVRLILGWQRGCADGRAIDSQVMGTNDGVRKIMLFMAPNEAKLADKFVGGTRG